MIIRRGLELGKPAILYSGGKDSSVLLDLITKQSPNALVIYNNTGLADPELIKFIRQQTEGMNFIETQAPDAIKMWKAKGNWPLLSKRAFNKYRQENRKIKVQPIMCCYYLKEKPARAIFKAKGVKAVFWGNRATESNRRKFAAIDHGFITWPKAVPWAHIYPLQHLTESDIKRYLQENHINRPKETQPETGCVCCGTDINRYPNNLSRLFLKDRKEWERYMRAGFAEQILTIKRMTIEPETAIVQNPEILLKIDGIRDSTKKRPG